MNISGQGHLLNFVHGHSVSTFSNLFSWETAKQIETKFKMEHSWDEEIKVNINGLCHMTKMATMPIYSKIL